MLPHIIVLGNEKGGTGKSTIAMHLAVALSERGYSVGTIDADIRQSTLSNYVDRRRIMNKDKAKILLFDHIAFQESETPHTALEAERMITNSIKKLTHKDVIIIDGPGNYTLLSLAAHMCANTIITPINDSFVDIDVLVKIDGESMTIKKPSVYAEMVWNVRREQKIKHNKSVEWIVLRNRLSNIYASNKEYINKIMDELSKRIGFNIVSGFCERVIFRSLFLYGLTVLDIEKMGSSMNISNIGAKKELYDLVDSIDLHHRNVAADLHA